MNRVIFRVITAAALMVAVSSDPVHVLRIDDMKAASPVFVRIIRPGNEFVLGYIHSVERTPVWDYFRVDNSCRIILFETAIRSFNAGLPSTLAGDERLRREGEEYRVSGMNRALPAIDLWVHEMTDSTLNMEGSEPVKLYALAGNRLLRIRISETSLGGYLYLKTKAIRL